jgi:DNA-binding NtrC family response regulator
MPVVLVIDDDRSVLQLVSKALAPLEVEVLTASTPDAGVKLVEERRPDVVLLDIIFPQQSGLDLFSQIQKIDRRLPVIFITAGAGSDTAIEAMQLGAYDYVAKPLDVRGLADLVSRALETRRMMSVPVAVPIGEVTPETADQCIGRSPQMLDVFKSIGRVAKQNVTVLVRGESGTGKELVARALYQHSNRRDQPFMAVNCAALPDTLLESELFGHEKGAFTSADRRRIGKFEQCSGGTLFLDEVGDMSPLVQSKVLRLLQEQRFERVGGNETITTDVRVVAATNRDLDKMVETGDFRADLLYRLNGVTIFLPPLRERPDDIPLLLQYFLTKARRDLNKPDLEGISSEAMQVLSSYGWPGNIRELQSVVRQSVLNSTGPVIAPEFLPNELINPRRSSTAAAETRPDGLPPSDLHAFIDSRLQHGTTNLYAETLEMMERYLFTRVLQETKGVQTKAAEILGITRGKIRDRIAAFNIQLDKSVTIDDHDPGE